MCIAVTAALLALVCFGHTEVDCLKVCFAVTAALLALACFGHTEVDCLKVCFAVTAALLALVRFGHAEVDCLKLLPAQAQDAEAKKRKRPKAPVGLGQLAAKKKTGTKGISSMIDKWQAVRKEEVRNLS